MVSSRVPVAQEQIYSLFDLIPGMEYCEMQRDQYGFSKGSIDHLIYNPLIHHQIDLDLCAVQIFICYSKKRKIHLHLCVCTCNCCVI